MSNDFFGIEGKLDKLGIYRIRLGDWEDYIRVVKLALEYDALK